MRRAAKIDANQVAIVAALRSAGCSVQHLHQVGEGCPDLLVGIGGRTLLVECKDGGKPPSKRRLTPDQMAWIGAWRGGAVWLVTNVSEALEAIK